MPYIARNEFDDVVTASQCLDEFIKEAIAYSDFRCAFCEVPYIAKCIYGENLVGKAPHFAVKRGELHRGDCDGEPIEDAPSSTRVKRTQSIQKRKFELPEKLVAKRPRRLVSVPTVRGIRPPPSPEEIEKRRKKAAKEYGGAALFTTSLLQVIVEAKQLLLRDCFREAKRRGLTSKERNIFIAETAAQYPLQLFEQKENFHTAFWNACYPRKGHRASIFEGANGTVDFSATGFEIRSEPTPKPGADPAKTVVAVLRYVGDTSEMDLPVAHRRLLGTLKAASGGQVPKWSAYGDMSSVDEQNVVTLESLDHLFVQHP